MNLQIQKTLAGIFHTYCRAQGGLNYHLTRQSKSISIVFWLFLPNQTALVCLPSSSHLSSNIQSTIQYSNPIDSDSSLQALVIHAICALGPWLWKREQHYNSACLFIEKTCETMVALTTSYGLIQFLACVVAIMGSGQEQEISRGHKRRNLQSHSRYLGKSGKKSASGPTPVSIVPPTDSPTGAF